MWYFLYCRLYVTAVCCNPSLMPASAYLIPPLPLHLFKLRGGRRYRTRYARLAVLGFWPMLVVKQQMAMRNGRRRAGTPKTIHRYVLSDGSELDREESFNSRSEEQVVLFRNTRLGPNQGEVFRKKWTCSLKADVFRTMPLVPCQTSVRTCSFIYHQTSFTSHLHQNTG